MKTHFSAVASRLFLFVMLATASLLPTACLKNDSVEPAKDYSTIDDEIIKKYLADNNITTAQRQPSGLYFLPVTTNPNGASLAAGSRVSVLYTGHLLDAAGTVFDASSQHGNTPITFVLGSGQLIPGFEAGVALMHIGDKAELLIPSALAYGPGGRLPSIPANAVLRFEVEVLDYTVIDEGIIKKYVADNALTAAQRQPSGLYYVPVTTNASAVQATAGKTVDVLYVGKFLDGRVFDSAQDRTKPFTFVLGRGQVIAGWDEGIALMHKGDKAVLLIPSAQAYGSRGAGNGAIPPNTVLRFDVELLDVR